MDDRYPKAITSYWGNVANPITRSGHVDAALVLQSPPEVEGGPERTHTYLFSGDQYVRYEGTDYATVDDGYPRDIGTSLAGEPRFANLTVALESGDRRRRGRPAVGVPVHRRRSATWCPQPSTAATSTSPCAAPAAPSSKTVR